MISDLLYELYKDKRTVFNIQEIALLIGEADFSKLKQRVNYYVRNNKLLNPRRGIYAKQNYRKEELACKIYKPSYISLDFVLQKHAITFQYDSRITLVSYLSRNIEVDGNMLNYRKLKNEILYNSKGILNKEIGVNIASPERAFLDTLYLNKEFYFDSLTNLDIKIIQDLLPIYKSAQLNKRVKQFF